MTASREQSPDTVLYAVDDGIATITLNRPDKLNALTNEMSALYLATLRRADQDPEARVVIVTGAGRGFCAGADFSRLEVLEVDEVRKRAVADPRDVAVWLGKPVIAAVNGAVAGAGFGHALMADVRFTVPAAKWTTAFAKVGLVAEIGMSWSLVNLVGSGRALDLLLSARTISGSEAYGYGLAQFLCEPDSLLDEARDYARLLAANDPNSLAEMRNQVRLDAGRSFREAWDDGYERVFAALERGKFRNARAQSRRVVDTESKG